jgi:hypothetical protein
LEQINNKDLILRIYTDDYVWAKAELPVILEGYLFDFSAEELTDIDKETRKIGEFDAAASHGQLGLLEREGLFRGVSGGNGVGSQGDLGGVGNKRGLENVPTPFGTQNQLGEDSQTLPGVMELSREHAATEGDEEQEEEGGGGGEVELFPVREDLREGGAFGEGAVGGKEAVGEGADGDLVAVGKGGAVGGGGLGVAEAALEGDGGGGGGKAESEKSKS